MRHAAAVLILLLTMPASPVAADELPAGGGVGTAERYVGDLEMSAWASAYIDVVRYAPSTSPRHTLGQWFEGCISAQDYAPATERFASADGCGRLRDVRYSTDPLLNVTRLSFRLPYRYSVNWGRQRRGVAIVSLRIVGDTQPAYTQHVVTPWVDPSEPEAGTGFGASQYRDVRTFGRIRMPGVLRERVHPRQYQYATMVRYLGGGAHLW